MRRCNQCWRKQPNVEFEGRKPGHIYQDCKTCRAKGRSPIANHRTRLPTEGEFRATFIRESKNRKLGPIPEVYVTASTCPPSCPHYNHGCYGESGLMREHWRNVKRHGLTIDRLCQQIDALPDGQLWRYATVGDLPGNGEFIDSEMLGDLAAANMGKRGFTYTHKKRPCYDLAINLSNALGFTINRSADSLEEADKFAALGPTVVTLPSDAPTRLKTPGGRIVRVCPAELDDRVNCSRCGLCHQSNKRRAIIGFRAHGLRKREVSDRCKLPVLP